ncbi:MAG: disulfide bond formation protein B [Gammaproteobacteria bacterium]
MTVTSRAFYFAGAALCFASLAIAYFYMERHLLLEPCPLCILDRLAVAAMGACFAASAFLPKWRRVLWGMNALFLAAGFVFAGRHIWLQNRPPDFSAGCLADSAAAESFMEIVRRAFDAKGDCGAIYWEFAGLSIPEQVLLLFAVFALMLAAQARVLFFTEGGR